MLFRLKTDLDGLFEGDEEFEEDEELAEFYKKNDLQDYLINEFDKYLSKPIELDILNGDSFSQIVPEFIIEKKIL